MFYIHATNCTDVSMCNSHFPLLVNQLFMFVKLLAFLSTLKSTCQAKLNKTCQDSFIKGSLKIQHGYPQLILISSTTELFQPTLSRSCIVILQNHPIKILNILVPVF